MDGLITIVIVTILMVPLHLAVVRELERIDSAVYLRETGVIILRDEALDARGEVIGRFADAPIHGEVTFKGTIYAFDRVTTPHYRDHIGRNELYLDPGLVYRAHETFEQPLAAGPTAENGCVRRSMH